MSDHEQPTQVYDDPDVDWYDDEDDATADALPVRPRRALLTPVSGTLAAIVLLAGGFIGGVQVQKHQGGSGSGAGRGAGGLPSGFAARLGAAGGGTAGGAQGAGGRVAGGGQGAGVGAAGGGQGAGAGAGRAGAGAATGTIGTVANVKGSTLYVTGPDGTTVKVKTDDNAKVTRNADSSVGNVHPGDTVIVQGAKADDGTVTATSITATAKGVSGGFAGFGAAAAGGATTRGSGAAGGSSTARGTGAAGGSGSAPPVPDGFAPPSG